MRKKEQKLWDTLHRHAVGKQLDLQRVENVVGVGMPDVYVGSSRCWIELKAPIAPAKETTRLLGNEGLNPDQVNWHLKAFRNGTRTYVLIRDSNQRLLMVPGKWADVMNDWTYTQLEKHSAASNWNDVIKEIL